MPRLIEMLSSSDRDIQDGARAGISLITMLPEREITAASAKEWWDMYHQASDSQIYASLLGAKNSPNTRLEAAKRLYRSQDKRIVPVLMDLMAGDDAPAAIGAAHLVERICGNNWGWKVAARKSNALPSTDRFREWWNDNQHTFVWLEFKNTGGGEDGAAPQRDPLREAVLQLSGIEAGIAEGAMATLRRAGNEAVPALLDGLAHPSDAVIRTRSRDLLREMTGQNFGFEPTRGSDADRGRVREEWINWATEEGLLALPEEE